MNDTNSKYSKKLDPYSKKKNTRSNNNKMIGQNVSYKYIYINIYIYCLHVCIQTHDT